MQGDQSSLGAHVFFFLVLLCPSSVGISVPSALFEFEASSHVKLLKYLVIQSESARLAPGNFLSSKASRITSRKISEFRVQLVSLYSLFSFLAVALLSLKAVLSSGITSFHFKKFTLASDRLLWSVPYITWHRFFCILFSSSSGFLNFQKLIEKQHFWRHGCRAKDKHQSLMS